MFTGTVFLKLLSTILILFLRLPLSMPECGEVAEASGNSICKCGAQRR